jgi:hypothetical protein
VRQSPRALRCPPNRHRPAKSHFGLPRVGDSLRIHEREAYQTPVPVDTFDLRVSSELGKAAGASVASGEPSWSDWEALRTRLEVLRANAPGRRNRKRPRRRGGASSPRQERPDQSSGQPALFSASRRSFTGVKSPLA